MLYPQPPEKASLWVSNGNPERKIGIPERTGLHDLKKKSEVSSNMIGVEKINTR